MVQIIKFGGLGFLFFILEDNFKPYHISCKTKIINHEFTLAIKNLTLHFTDNFKKPIDLELTPGDRLNFDEGKHKTLSASKQFNVFTIKLKSTKMLS